jgi:WD40 repeat protein
MKTTQTNCIVTPFPGLAAVVAAIHFLICPAPAARGADAPKGGDAWKLQAAWKGHAKEVNRLAFSPDGKTVASLGGDGVVKLWDVNGSKERATLRLPRTTIVGCGYGADGKTLITVSADGMIKVWDTTTTRVKSSVSLRLRDAVILGTFAADGKVLATTTGNLARGGAPGEVQLWDVARAKKRGALTGHEMFTTFLTFSADGKKLATAGERYVGVDAPSGNPTQTDVKLWNLANGKDLGTMPLGAVAAFSPDNKLLATSCTEGKAVKPTGFAKLWDLGTGKEKGALKGHTSYLTALAFSLDGKLLASASADKTVKLWDVAAVKELATLKGHTGAVNAVAFSPDGQMLVTAGADRTVRLWVVTKPSGDSKNRK